MPLIACPDCGREISETAPACIHCGRPMAPAPGLAADPAARPKPIAGIAAVLVIGGYAILRVLFPKPTTSTNPAVLDFREMWSGVQVLGNSAAIIGALMAMMGHRAGNKVVRTASATMIPITLALLAMTWTIFREIPGAETSEGHTALVLLTGALVVAALAPWLLFLFLFRRSKYG